MPLAISFFSAMNRRQFLANGAAAVAGMATFPNINWGRIYRLGDVEISIRAADLVGSCTVVDMLGLLTMDWDRLVAWFRHPSRFDFADFWKLKGSGVDIFNPAVETSFEDPRAGAMWWLRGWRQLLDNLPCYAGRVNTLSDVVRLPYVGKIGVIIGLQNSTHFESAHDVTAFFDLGQRLSQLTYNSTNRLGSGCLATPDVGLTEFGADVVSQMNRIGMAVDISHCGDRTSIDAIEASTAPVLITHSNARALVPGQPRCKPDSIIRKVAEKGGVMGITTVRAFVGRTSPSIETLLDHFDHVARLVGIEHVGLGTDVSLDALDPSSGQPLPIYRIRGLDLRLRVYQITDGLLRRGYSRQDVEAVLGGNFIRALAEIGKNQPWEPLPGAEALERDPFCPPRQVKGRSGEPQR